MGSPSLSPSCGRPYRAQRVQGLLEAVGVRTLGLGQGLEPVGDFVETFVTCDLGHARVHVGVLVGFAGDGGLQVVGGGAERQAGGGIAALFQVFQMAVRMAGFAFGGGTEHGGNVVVAFHVGLCCEVEVTAIGLRFAGEGGLQMFFSFRALELHNLISLIYIDMHRQSILSQPPSHLFIAVMPGDEIQ